MKPDQFLKTLIFFGIAAYFAGTMNIKAGNLIDFIPAIISASQKKSNNIGIFDSIKPQTTFADDFTGHTGLLTGRVADTGQTWNLTGPGYNTAIIDAAGFVTNPSALNTYCRIDTGSKVHSYTQRFSGGHTATLSIMANIDLSEMLHVNFYSGSNVSFLYWHAPDVSQVVHGLTVSNCPVFTDPAVPHDLTVVIIDNLAIAYADGIVVAIAQDDIIPVVTGSSIYGQLHATTTDRIWSMTAGNRPLTMELPSYTVSTLPSAGNLYYAQIVVTDGTPPAGSRIAVYDGTHWLWSDGSIVQ